MISIEAKLISSLEKVFPLEHLPSSEVNSGTMLKNEIFSFQLALKSKAEFIRKTKIKLDSTISEYIEIYTVGYVHSDLPAYESRDDDYICVEPGLFPDVLYLNESYECNIENGIWNSLWFSINSVNGIEAGNYPIKIYISDGDDNMLAVKEYFLRVIDKQLPKQKLIHTEWFYTDCIASYYGVSVFSGEYWELVEKYMRIAVKYGVNMILTPVFTPPLDTPYGKERPTVQLVDVRLSDGEYTFGFEKLRQWIKLALSCGIEYFEISHLFTQWGAKHAPKIMVETDMGIKQLFGWHTDASDPIYTDFIVKFLKALIDFIDVEGIKHRCFFHVSDEPQIWDMGTYKRASDTVRSVLKDDFTVIDALSDYEFYSSGAVRNPIPSNDHIDAFLANNVQNLWTYYCCAQGDKVSNRFMSMPSYRNRIIGIQLYKYGLKGFLHWGFNFWYKQNLLELINPFLVTDAGMAFPSGDPFLVYPGGSGPLPSIRMLVFNEAMQDIRAFELLESLSSRDEVLSIFNPDNGFEISFSQYPRASDFLLSVRARVNERIAELG